MLSTRMIMLLIALGLDAAHRSSQGAAVVGKQLRTMGTGDQEIAEALRIAHFAFGNSILSTSVAAFSGGDEQEEA